MAIIGRIEDVGLTQNGLSNLVRVEFFDDADATNTGVGPLPPQTIIARAAFTYDSLEGQDLQNAVKADVKAKILQLTAAQESNATARQFLPIGALINSES